MASNKPRSLLVAAAVVLGVAMIMAASTTNRAIDDCLTSAAEQVVGRADLEVRAFSERGLSAQSLESIASTPGVKSAVPFVRKRTYFRGQEHRGFVELIGIDPLLETEMHTYHVSEGVFLADEVSNSALLIDNWAQEHGFERGEDMEVITVDGFRSFKVVGLLSQAGLGESSFGRVIFVSLRTAQAMFGLENRISHVSVELLPGESVERVAEELEGRIEEQFIVMPGEMIAKGLRGSLHETQGLLLLLGAVALFVGAFLIYNTWAITVSERSRDIGLLRAGGATSTQVLSLFLYEALLLATVGSLVGVVVGWGLARMLARWVCITQQVVIRAVPLGLSDLLFSLAAGIGVSLLAAVVPAWQGSRLTAIAALRPEYGRPAAGRGRLWWALGLGTVVLGAALMLLSQRALVVGALGVVLLCIGLVPLSQPLITPLARFASLPFHWLFGRQGDLAIRNLARTPRRTSLTVAGLTVAVAVVVALAVSVASSSTAGQRWVTSLFAGEWLVVSPVTQPMVFADQLSALEGVDTILPARNFAVNWQGRYLGAVGLPLVDSLVRGAFEIGAEERREAISLLEQEPGVVIPRLLAQRYALSVGDELVLRTEQGDWPFHVVAIVGHSLPAANEEGAILLPWDTMTTYFGLTGFDLLQVIPREGIETAAFEEVLASRAEQYGMETSSIEEIAGTVRSAITRLFALLAAMVAAGLIVGGLGIANTMMVNVNERRREIGLLRAAGMTAEQILVMVLMEAATIGAMGGVLGTLAGLVLSTVIVEFSRSADFDPQYVIPLALLTAAFLLPMAVSVAAAVYPAKSAASLSVVESLRYE